MIVALSGYAGSGKDSVADVFVQDYGFTKLAFAQPIKDALWALNPALEFNGFELVFLQMLVTDPKNDEQWREAKDWPYETRDLLQVESLFGIGLVKTFGLICFSRRLTLK